MMDVAVEKGMALLIMTLVTLLASCMPLLLRHKILAYAKKEVIEKLLSGFLCFGAGIFLATTFIHLMPETRNNVEIAIAKEYIPAYTFPLAEMIFCGGFFLIYIVEEFLHIFVNHFQRTSEDEHKPERKCRDTRLSSIGVLNFSSLSPDPMPRTHRISSIGALQMNSVPHLDIPSLTASSAHENVVSLIVPDIYGHNKINRKKKNSIHINIVQAGPMKSLMIIGALSAHSIFEGVAIGIEKESMDMWMIWAAITSHKVIIAFSLGMELLEKCLEKGPYLAAMIAFSVASPLGGIIGILTVSLSTEETAVGFMSATFLQGLSGGCILYVTFCEILERERAREHGSLMRLLTLMAGFVIMCGMEFLGAHNHHGDHIGHDHGHHGEHFHNHTHENH